MNWFDEFEEESPTFDNCSNFICNKKQQYNAVRDGAKCLPHKYFHNEHFNPNNPSSIESNFLIENHRTDAVETLLSELNDKRKAVRNHLSSAGIIFS